MPIRIAGTGCALMDRLFVGVDFGGEAFRRYRSLCDGDGGLSPGKLVFVPDAEHFAKESFDRILENLVPGSKASAENIGGPSIVAMIHAAQMLAGPDFHVSFHGLRGDDETGDRLAALLAKLPVDCSAYGMAPGPTPSTFVLSDPSWDGGHGERCFVNDIGVAAGYNAEKLLEGSAEGSGFLDADIVVFGGTGLVPALHDGLGDLLPEARARGCLTVVNTVFDFRNERRDPVHPWPLGRPGDSPRSFGACELLIMDRDEALRLSGTTSLDAAASFFVASGVSAFVITRGAGDVIAWTSGGKTPREGSGRSGGRFAPLALSSCPVSARAGREIRENQGPGGRGGPRGDTTGCGDAFAGGIVAALAEQMLAGRDRDLDLKDAILWGIAAGAATLGIVGGTWYEKVPGEKRAVVESYRADYFRQIAGESRDAGPGSDQGAGRGAGPVEEGIQS